MQRVDLKVGFACNNLCTFCVQGDKRFRYPQRTLEEIKTHLDTEYAKGLRAVVFTGGEPTVHTGLVEAVAHAKNIGYISIQIQSNGRKFSDPTYVDALIQAWANEFWPSIHGFYPGTHDTEVCAPGAWMQVVEGLRILSAKWQCVMTNTVITKRNYRELPKLAALLVKLGVRQFQFAFIHIAGSALKNQHEIVPKKTEILPYLFKALDIGKAAWIPCMAEAMPYCVMQGYEWAIAENFMPETTVYDAEGTMESYIDYRWNEGKAKRSKCESCSKNAVCEGPWKEYPELYWWEEFEPIP